MAIGKLAVPCASDVRIMAGPGRISPPAKTLSGPTVSMVVAVPKLASTKGGCAPGRRDSTPSSEAQRSAPNCVGTR
ncbi:hypothetical protein D3C78_1497630 [compost metagenome]